MNALCGAAVARLCKHARELQVAEAQDEGEILAQRPGEVRHHDGTERDFVFGHKKKPVDGTGQGWVGFRKDPYVC